MNPDNELTGRIIGAAIEVHRALGPGLLESAYHACLMHELMLQKIPFESEKPLELDYKGKLIDCAYRLDFLVAMRVIVELKAVDKLNDIHRAQILTYLKLAKCKIGLLINFNVYNLSKGIERFAL
jgi:GxxExxY protein